MNQQHKTSGAGRYQLFGTIALLALMSILGGCASENKEYCKQADWRQIGYTDGVKGLSGAQIDEHARTCAPYGVRPDFNAYMTGRSQGLVSYCQPQNGLELGRSGATGIIGDCPANLKVAFENAYKTGRAQRMINYCQPQNGFDLGQRGVKDINAGECPDNLRLAFQDAYQAGRTQRLVTYCQPQNGFDLGRRGVADINAGECPDHLRLAFQDAYNDGRQVNSMEFELASRRRQLEDTQHQIHHNDERIKDIKSEMLKPNLSNERRAELLKEYNHLLDQKDSLIRTSQDLDAQVAHLEHRLNQKLRELGRL